MYLYQCTLMDIYLILWIRLAAIVIYFVAQIVEALATGSPLKFAFVFFQHVLCVVCVCVLM